MRCTLYTLLAATVLLSSCRPDTGGGYELETFHIVNMHSDSVNIYLYASDYDHSISYNPIYKSKVAAGGSISMPASGPVSAYYADIYTDDHAYNNWLAADMTFGGPADSYREAVVTKNNAKRTLLQGDKTRTDWIAIDALDALTLNSIWTQLADDERHLKFVVTKKKEVTVQRKELGELRNYKMNATINAVGEGFELLFSTTGFSGGTENYHGSTDTLLYMSHDMNNRRYVLVRE